MAFQTPVTVEDVLTKIHHKQYLLPAIQREFVWNADQIRRLVDSLMRGYPIGSFLFWQVKPEFAKDYAFYDFLTHYHEKDAPYATKATVPAGHGVTAILDGQQRLTALNIALYGTHAEKRKYLLATHPDAFPKKALYLDLLAAPKDDDDLDLHYELRFLTAAEAKPVAGDPDKWIRVGDVLALPDGGKPMIAELKKRGIDLGHDHAYDNLYALYEAFRKTKSINYYLLDEGQTTDEVVDIFVRVNSGGTALSHSDLLLTVATNLWTAHDAREEVRELVKDLNSGGGRRFGFSKDVALKTALMVAGGDIKFKVGNFTPRKMATVEAQWSGTRDALVLAAALLHGFGFEAKTLTADSVIIPIACYLRHRGLDDSYRTSATETPDRARLQNWVVRSLLKRGIWGSGLDGLLTRIRQTIEDHGSRGFPVEEIERGMASLGKSLSFDEEEVDDLLGAKFGNQRTFAILALLYPGHDLTIQYHQDHFFPKSRFTRKQLADAGIPADRIPTYLDSVNLLPNLQLQAAIPGIQKSAALPAEWLAQKHWTETARKQYLTYNDLDGLPLGLADFLDFIDQRRERMRTRLTSLLGVRARP
jgi:hypothetical protein